MDRCASSHEIKNGGLKNPQTLRGRALAMSPLVIQPDDDDDGDGDHGIPLAASCFSSCFMHDPTSYADYPYRVEIKFLS